MRTEVLGVRFSTAIFIVVAVGAVALIAGGVYHHYTGKPSGELADRTRSASISTEAGEATGSLVIHDAPQAVPDLSFVDGDGREMSLGTSTGGQFCSTSGPPGACRAARKCLRSIGCRRSLAVPVSKSCRFRSIATAFQRSRASMTSSALRPWAYISMTPVRRPTDLEPSAFLRHC